MVEQALVRDEHGHFISGHPSFISKGDSKIGRPKTLKREVKDALAIADDAMPDIIRAMIRRANGEDECPVAVRQAAAEYLCDRIYGRPNQPISGANGKALEIIVRWGGFSDDLV